MRLIFTFLRSYPAQSAVTLGALLLAGLIEGFGLSLIVPLLSIAVSGEGIAGAAEASGAASTLEQMIRGFYGFFGLTPTIGGLLILFVATMVIKAFIMLAAHKKVGYTVAQVATDLRLNLIRALFTTRWEYFISQPAGSLTNSIATEAGRAAHSYLNGIKIMAALLHTIVYAAIAFLVSWKATLAALAASIFIIILFRRYVEKSKKSGSRQTKLLNSLLAFLTDSLIMIKPLKTMAREHLADAVLQKKIVGLKKAIKQNVFASTALSALQEPVSIAFLASGLYAVLVIWKLPIANVLVMMYMIQKVMKRLKKVQTLYQGFVVGESAYWSLEKKTNRAKETKEILAGNRKISLNHSICLDDVSFHYGDRWILKNAELEFPKGSFTAIVGSSGVGKTTVVDLMTGLLRPQEGEILIDGIPLAEIDIRHWRQMIGYVPQETLLLHDTVFENVTLGDKELSVEDVEYALRASGAWEFVQDLSDGFNTVVGERGHKISGGQRQRIAIARAIVHHPKLLILDEATTALDPESEAAICETLRGLKGKHTILAISHQPAILKVAERAYRLEGGKAYPVADLLTPEGEEVDISAATA